MKRKKETFEKLHGPLKNRRDFLACGLIPFAATLTLNPVAHLLGPRRAWGQAAPSDCPQKSSLTPIITVNLAGGAGLMANVLMKDEGGQMLPTYNKMGLGTGGNLQLTREFANQIEFPSISQFLDGFVSNTDTLTRGKISFVPMPVRSRDDSSENPWDITGLVGRAGHSGKILPNLGRRNSDTGTRQSFAFVKPSPPLLVNGFNSIESALRLQGAFQNMNQKQKLSLFKMVSSLNERQAQKLLSLTGGQEMQKLMNCASSDNINLVGAQNLGIDPTENAAVSGVWGIDANGNRNSQDFVFATMVYNALNGNCGPANLDIGGYDYHNGTRTTGDTRDREAGDLVGKIFATAALMGQKVFVIVTSDGSVTSPVSNDTAAPWVSDRGSAGCAYMLAYDPVVAPSVARNQLGWFTSAQAASNQFYTGDNVKLAAATLFLNYLSFSLGDAGAGIFEQVLPRTLTSTQIEQGRIISG